LESSSHYRRGHFSFSSRVDIQLIATFRQVNRNTTEKVNAILFHKPIVKEAGLAFQCLLMVGAAKGTTWKTFRDTLFSRKCEECGGSFASQLCLITCERICSFCSRREPKYSPLHPIAEIQFALDEIVMKTVPCIPTVEGLYASSHELSDVRGRESLVDMETCKEIALAFYGSLVNMLQKVEENRKQL
jgi:hypothetical protein